MNNPNLQNLIKIMNRMVKNTKKIRMSKFGSDRYSTSGDLVGNETQYRVLSYIYNRNSLIL